MDKPRIFLGSSGKQAKLLQALTRGLERRRATSSPGRRSSIPAPRRCERLVELTREVDFAAFVFAQDDWTTRRAGRRGAGPGIPARQRRVRGRPVRRRARHAPDLHPPRQRREAADRPARPHLRALPGEIDAGRDAGRSTRSSARRSRTRARLARIEGAWWQFSLTARTARSRPPQPAEDLPRPRRRAGADRPRLARGRQAVGALLERGGRRRRTAPASSTTGTASGRSIPNAPQLDGTGEILLDSATARPATG